MKSDDNSSRNSKSSSVRPFRRVLAFLEEEVQKAGPTPKRLPTIRELAEQLDVSPRTVQKVFHQLADEGKIESVTGRGTFTRPGPGRSASGNEQLHIGLNIELDRYDPVGVWAYTVYGAILQAAVTSKRNALFMTVAEALERQRDVRPDGFILLPDPYLKGPEELRKVAPDVPVVFMNPPSLSDAANFVSPDYHRMAWHLGQAWARAGKRRIVLLHHPELPNTPSGQLVMSGLITGLGDSFRNLEYFRLVNAGDFTLEAGSLAITGFLDQEKAPPDAVFCKGDFLAVGAVRALQSAGLTVPGDVSVVGGSGLDLSETDCPNLTRARQPLQEIGAALFSMLLQRIEGDGVSVPGRFLPTPFIGGGTTSPEENAHLMSVTAATSGILSG
jgi:DNA-binding LacI/PurR family transcriptional regulator